MGKISNKLASEGAGIYCNVGLCLKCVKFDPSQKESQRPEGKICPYDAIGG